MLLQNVRHAQIRFSGGWCLVTDESFAVNYYDLWHNRSIHQAEPHESRHCVARYPTYWKVSLICPRKCADQIVCLALVAPFVSAVNGYLQGLKPLAAVFLLQPAQGVRGRLAMRAGCQNEVQHHHFAPVLAEQALTLARYRKSDFRRLMGSRGGTLTSRQSGA